MSICAGCKKAISGQYVTIGKTQFCVGCFKCAECEKSLSGVAFMNMGDAYMCKPCYVELNCDKCAFCKKPITSGAVVTVGANKYHEACYEKKQSGMSFTATPKAEAKAKDPSKPTCVKICNEDDTGNKYHDTCSSDKRKDEALVCMRCEKKILKGSFVRDIDESTGKPTGKVCCKPCYDVQMKEEQEARSAKIRAGGAASVTAPAAVAPKSLKEIEDGLADGTGLVSVGGQTVTVKRGGQASGPTVSHAGAAGTELPPALERDLAKVARDKAADRKESSLATAEQLQGREIDGVRFEAQGFCNKDIIEEVKKKPTKVGKMSGTYKLKGGVVDVTWKERKWTHRDFTGGKASKDERIRPLQHQLINV